MYRKCCSSNGNETKYEVEKYYVEALRFPRSQFYTGAGAVPRQPAAALHCSGYNAARYCQTLDKLREAIRRKRPRQLTIGVILQHDNATPHTARVTQGWLEKCGWEILPHPPHSPDLAATEA
ncbi:LOW QUALITY PROTEIN: histone-lysine N-methyltransferase SETMAR [Elysia marginata]|uniref:Histone-lysine N-methyltransferase SETMAR n=1 Tax=Elysia marginata TaxID=1093978 RepID=A0AAV4FM42_9GAST|nr:LOW QUALITY PROTEIN: histone-lysine N-methyltransferase SETMAR [Elysia marginata]